MCVRHACFLHGCASTPGDSYQCHETAVPFSLTWTPPLVDAGLLVCSVFPLKRAAGCGYNETVHPSGTPAWRTMRFAGGGGVVVETNASLQKPAGRGRCKRVDCTRHFPLKAVTIQQRTQPVQQQEPGLAAVPVHWPLLQRNCNWDTCHCCSPLPDEEQQCLSRHE